MTNNFAFLAGSIASGDLFQLFELKNCFISENNALVGSIATFTKGKNVFIEGTMFSKNTAYAYGGLSLETTSLNLKSSFFNGNYAYGRGAAILVSGVSAQDAVIGVEDIAIMVNNCTFDGNQIVFANRQSFEHFEGAAIAFENCRHLSVVKNSTFIGNSAQFGGAIFSQASIVNISSSKFIRNSADFGGGAIYWEIDSENGRVVDVSSDVENFENWAQFGGFKATDTFRMAVASGPTVVTSGQEVSEPFVITLLDYYDEVVKYEVSNTSNIVYVLTVEDQISAIQGTTLVEAVDGYATFKSLTITYYPETNLDIRFDLSGVPALYYNVEFR